MGRLTREDRNDTSCTRARRGITVVELSYSEAVYGHRLSQGSDAEILQYEGEIMLILHYSTMESIKPNTRRIQTRLGKLLQYDTMDSRHKKNSKLLRQNHLQLDILNLQFLQLGFSIL